ncbi:hypothetical protein Q3G72_032564 [Acer saccharum]|nr:hypothetical protein Q3G72_032564 [Acer saccharum]
MVGHLGQLYLSSSAIAISFSAVTGFSLVYGMSTALETLNGQAYGAEQYQRLGIQTYTALFGLILFFNHSFGSFKHKALRFLCS